MSWPAVDWSTAPIVSSAELRAADAGALNRFGIQPLQLMEVAGWQVSRFIDAYLDGAAGKRITVVAGSGNNGGDALCVARFLQRRGSTVVVSRVPARDPTSLAAHQAKSVQALGVPISVAPGGLDQPADLVVDGLFGTGIRPPLRAPAPAIISAINRTGAPVIAIDVPSGMDADDGAGADQAVRATATVTLAAPKAGLRAQAVVGRVFLADIGMPHALFPAAGPALQALFAHGDLVELVEAERR